MIDSSHTYEPHGAVEKTEDRLTSGDLAALIVDALQRAEILESEDVERAIRIGTEEIDARKAIGDY